MGQTRKLTAIVGATSGIAEACGRIWASEGGRDFVLFGRRVDALEAIAADLKVRDPKASVQVFAADLSKTNGIDKLVSDATSAAPFDTVLIAFGVLPEQDEMQNDNGALEDNLVINGTAPVIWAEACARASGDKSTKIAVIGSVAGDRGRKTNYAYGAAKGLVERYVEGMQHRFAKGGPVLTLIKPGPTKTAMTAAMDQSKMAPVEDVAADIVRGVAKGKPVVYTPGKWAVIMTIIRALPRFVFNKLDI